MKRKNVFESRGNLKYTKIDFKFDSILQNRLVK